MESADLFQLRLVLDDGSYFAYKSPPEAACIQLSSCPHWQAAKSVEWRNLPAHSYVSFFQSDKCASRDGDVFSSAGNKVMTGVHTFKTPRAIRSIFTRPSSGKRNVVAVRKCVQLRHQVEFSSLVVDGGNASVDADMNAGFSSNWFEPIEDGNTV